MSHPSYKLLVPLAVALTLLPVTRVLAGGCATCEPAAAAPATCEPTVQYVEKTVLCPVWVTETRMCTVTQCRPEVRQCEVTVCRRVMETKEVQRQCTTMVPEMRTRTEQYMTCKPVVREETREYTEMVPVVETREGTRTVCKVVPEKQKKIVCEDQGHWEERSCGNPCGACDPCAPVCKCRCWVPNVVQKEIEVTCMKAVQVEEPCTYQVTVCKPVTKTCKVKVCDFEQVPATREVCYTVCVPKTYTKTEHVTTCRYVPVKETKSYTVMVPYQVQKPVTVRVCKMEPKTIRVPVCPTSCCQQVCCKPCRPRCCR